MWKSCVSKMSRKRDVESGERTLYPSMLENPQLRWSFIRKVYSIITFQLLLTIAAASVVVFVPPVAHFFVGSTHGLILYIVLIFVPFISTCRVLLYYVVMFLNTTLLLNYVLFLQHYVRFIIINRSILSITSSS